MRKILMTFVAALGLAGFAAGAQAACMDMAEADVSPTVATDTTPKPILQEQSGG